jgi:hypothetical protein
MPVMDPAGECEFVLVQARELIPGRHLSCATPSRGRAPRAVLTPLTRSGCGSHVRTASDR